MTVVCSVICLIPGCSGLPGEWCHSTGSIVMVWGRKGVKVPVVYTMEEGWKAEGILPAPPTGHKQPLLREEVPGTSLVVQWLRL